jgi:cytochrome P450
MTSGHPPAPPTRPAPARTLPTTGMPLAVRLWRGLRDPLAFLTDLEARHGDIVSLRAGRSVVVFRPDLVKHVLQDNYTNYEKGQRYRKALTPLMGNGLFTSEGAFWLRQRRLAQGAFQRSSLPAFASVVLKCLDELLPEWERKARDGTPVDARADLVGLTLRATLRMLFGVDASREMPALAAAIGAVNEEMHLARAFLPWHPAHWLPTPGQRRFDRGLAFIDDFVGRVIARRQAEDDPGSDLLGLLVAARDPETGERMDARQLRDESVTMLNAGHETVADASVWTLLQLAMHPEAQARARDEMTAVIGSSAPTVDGLAAMPYLGRVFRETLRLCPPGWAFSRDAIADDDLDGYRIGAGTMVVLSPFVVHRSARYWERPLDFEPDRFLPEASAGRPRFAYFPFGSGPRMCIGAGVASMEAPLMVAALLQRFAFELPADQVVAFSPRLSLRPKGNVRLRLRSLQN